jgi:hypothetical protein
MNYMPILNRRAFLVSSTAAGLTLGFHIPLEGAAQAQTTTPEINAWVVIKPDDTVVIRIARSEMGQGTRTGLPSWWRKNCNATGRRSRPNIRPPVRMSPAIACGRISRPAAAAASATRMNMSVRAAPPRA